MFLAHIKMLDLEEIIDRVIDLEPLDDKMIKEMELKKHIDETDRTKTGLNENKPTISAII